MVPRNMRMAGMMTIVVVALLRCADSNSMAGNSGDKKDAKKSKPDDSNNTFGTTTGSNDASQPQVITGAYLACVQDQGPDAKAGENSFGCGVYNTQTEQKIDLTGKTLQLSVTDLNGQAIASRMGAAPANTMYHQFLYSAGDSSSQKINGRVIGPSGDQQFNATIRPVQINTISDGFSLKSNHTPAEIGAWCALATSKPDSPNDLQTALIKGSACGAAYLCRHNYTGNLATCITGTVGTFIGMFGGSSSSNPNSGVCLDASLLNQAVFAQRCNQ